MVDACDTKKKKAFQGHWLDSNSIFLYDFRIVESCQAFDASEGLDDLTVFLFQSSNAFCVLLVWREHKLGDGHVESSRSGIAIV